MKAYAIQSVVNINDGDVVVRALKDDLVEIGILTDTNQCGISFIFDHNQTETLIKKLTKLIGEVNAPTTTTSSL